MENIKDKIYKVYMHTTPNGKKYIGYTGQKLENRWGAGENYKQHKYFYNAIKKYGWNNIKHELLFETSNKEQALEKEMYYIQKFKSNEKQYGYNNSMGGDSGFNGGKHSQESIIKIKEKSKINEFARKYLSKPVAQYDLQGNLICIYESITDASIKTGICRTTIEFGCKNRTKNPQKYFWEYLDGNNIKQKINIKNKIKPRKDNKLFTYNGKTQTIKQWANECNIKYNTLMERLGRRKIPIEIALNTPIDESKFTKKYKEKLENYRKGENENV